MTEKILITGADGKLAVDGASSLAASFVHISYERNDGPLLWTTGDGQSLFSFKIQVNMDSLLKFSGIQNIEEVRAHNETLFLCSARDIAEAAAADHPAVSFETLSRRLQKVMEKTFKNLCNGAINGYCEPASVSDPYIGLRINVPAESALSSLFGKVPRRQGFVEPAQSVPLKGEKPPANLQEFIDILNQAAMSAARQKKTLTEPPASKRIESRKTTHATPNALKRPALTDGSPPENKPGKRTR